MSILDHKGEKSLADYWIVHQTGLQRCIDEKRSDVRLNVNNPEIISTFKQLVVDEGVVAAEVLLFRPARYPFVVLVERQLARAIEREGFSGVGFIDLDKLAP